MISKINDKPAKNSLCLNCKTELRAMVVDTNQGKQALYVCENDNCKRRYDVTTGYFPPAETGEPAPAPKNT